MAHAVLRLLLQIALMTYILYFLVAAESMVTSHICRMHARRRAHAQLLQLTHSPSQHQVDPSQPSDASTLVGQGARRTTFIDLPSLPHHLSSTGPGLEATAAAPAPAAGHQGSTAAKQPFPAHSPRAAGHQADCSLLRPNDDGVVVLCAGGQSSAVLEVLPPRGDAPPAAYVLPVSIGPGPVAEGRRAPVPGSSLGSASDLALLSPQGEGSSGLTAVQQRGGKQARMASPPEREALARGSGGLGRWAVFVDARRRDAGALAR